LIRDIAFPTEEYYLPSFAIFDLVIGHKRYEGIHVRAAANEDFSHTCITRSFLNTNLEHKHYIITNVNGTGTTNETFPIKNTIRVFITVKSTSGHKYSFPIEAVVIDREMAYDVVLGQDILKQLMIHNDKLTAT
jgi:hypothetical protein